MTRGRKPKPKDLKIYEGNPGKRSLDSGGVEAPVGLPDCPFKRGAIAYKEWHRVVHQLVKTHGLSPIHRGTLHGYCANYERAVLADQKIEELGLLVSGPGDTLVKNPAVTISDAAWKAVRSFASEFGLSPSSQTRVKTETSSPGGDLEAFAATKNKA